MCLLTADTIIKVKQLLPLPRRRELTGETRIRLSQIVDLLTWRTTTTDEQGVESPDGAESPKGDKKKVGGQWKYVPVSERGGSGKKKEETKGKKKQKSVARRKFEQNHKQTKSGNRSAKNNTPMRKPKIAVNKDIPVTKTGKAGDKPVGILLKGQEITNRTSIARGEGIDCVDRLKKTYDKENTDLWSKDEGNGIVLIKGKALNMTLHFYSYNEEEIYEPKQHWPKKRR